MVIVMTVIPCCLFDNCPAEREHTEQHASNDAEEHSSGDEDGCGTCSPFFTCSTCSTAINLATPFTYNLEPITVQESNIQYGFYTSLDTSFFLNAIWQPPKTIS